MCAWAMHGALIAAFVQCVMRYAWHTAGEDHVPAPREARASGLPDESEKLMKEDDFLHRSVYAVILATIK